MNNLMHSMFRRKKYEVRHVTRLRDELAGDCDHPDTKGKVIRILKGITGKELLRVYIHEAWHAIDKDMSEESVSEASEDMTNFLWKLGYRKHE